ncbi:MAG: hypothetical protein IJZ35_04535 [Clostridia bacterium]|nr:hypothetical protein [Clostridia bacterium]
MLKNRKTVFTIASDLIFSVAGLMLMNGMLQLLINPTLNNWLGENAFGNYQSIIAVVSIMGTTFGVAANYSRMVRARDKKDTNGDYNIFLAIISVACIAVSAGTLLVYKSFNIAHFILLTVLMIVTVLRYYGDVNYRIKLNYKGFFVYYAIITAGYCLGLLVFKYISEQWMLTFILGELAAVIFVALHGDIFKGKNLLVRSPEFKDSMKSVGILSATNILSSIAQQSDKIILRLAMSGEAVTTFYVSTLMGKVVSLLTTPLNGVLIGYLTKYDGKFTKKMFSVFALVLLGIGIIALFACYIASVIFVKFLYPDVFEDAKQYFFLANAGQVFYFIANCLMTVILRVASEKYQMYINIIYIIIYAVTVIPLTISMGIRGITIALLITNAAKFIMTAIVGFAKTDSKAKIKD